MNVTTASRRYLPHRRQPIGSSNALFRLARPPRSTAPGTSPSTGPMASAAISLIVHPASDADELEARQHEQQEEQEHGRPGLQSHVVADR